jgi:MerR family transcriptional regulator, light-induced transcriptional regulator
MIRSSILSTIDVAGLLKVNESTVKRWTEKGVLRCFKTPGGHRKYTQEDVSEFIERYGYKVDEAALQEEPSPPQPAAVSADYAILTKHHASLSSMLTEILLRGSEDETFQFLNLLRINRFTLVELYDRIVAESLRQIGALWVDRAVTIDQEHIATNCVLQAIGRLQTLLPKSERMEMTALCGCFGEEFHDVGITCIRNVLEAEGWNTVFIGANLPVESFIQAVKRFRPQLVCISSTTPKTKLHFRRDCSLVHEAAKQVGAKLAAGGSATRQCGKNKVDADFIAGTTTELLGWVRAQFPAA